MLGANHTRRTGRAHRARPCPVDCRPASAGGKLVVVDRGAPKTAERRRHLASAPAADALSCSRSSRAVRENLVDLGDVAPYVDGVDEIGSLSGEFTRSVASACVSTRRRSRHRRGSRPHHRAGRSIGTVRRSWDARVVLVDVLTCAPATSIGRGAMFTTRPLDAGESTAKAGA